MVEGPGCKLKGLKIKGKLKGQSVKDVRGNAADKNKKKDPNGLSQFHQLIGRTLDGVQTLGKELFMYFGDLCLRVHFLMAGQSFINNEKVDNDFGGNADTASLELQMSNDLLTFKKSSVDIRSAELCKQKYEALNDLDICSPVFNFPRAVALVKEQQDRLVCDVLLDQSILPGVGNIIKNEALFDSGIKPSSKISELKDEHISHLMKMTRDFTNIFYQCRRDGKPLHVHYKIYGKRKCKQCEGKVTICRLGVDNERMTYFCETCQTNDLKNKQRKLPMKGSLLGWVQSGDNTKTTGQIDWSCDSCTFINKPTSSSCNMCLTPRCKATSSDTDSLTADGRVAGCSDECNRLGNRRKRLSSANLDTDQVSKNRKIDTIGEHKINTSAAAANTQLKTPPLKSTSHSGRGISQNLRQSNSQSNLKSQPLTQIGNGASQKLSQSDPPRNCKSVNNSQSQAMAQMSSSEKIPFCKTHKRKCNMKEVRKTGNNLGRWFFSCPVRSCNFFEWADEKFPLCPDHGKPCTIRTVLKIGPNNGRKFFACKMPKKKQCKFFEWAHGYD